MQNMPLCFCNLLIAEMTFNLVIQFDFTDTDEFCIVGSSQSESYWFTKLYEAASHQLFFHVINTSLAYSFIKYLHCFIMKYNGFNREINLLFTALENKF